MFRFDLWFPYELANFPAGWDSFACLLATAMVNLGAWLLWASPLIALVVWLEPKSTDTTCSTGPA